MRVVFLDEGPRDRVKAWRPSSGDRIRRYGTWRPVEYIQAQAI